VTKYSSVTLTYLVMVKSRRQHTCIIAYLYWIISGPITYLDTLMRVYGSQNKYCGRIQLVKKLKF